MILMKPWTMARKRKTRKRINRFFIDWGEIDDYFSSNYCLILISREQEQPQLKSESFHFTKLTFR